MRDDLRQLILSIGVDRFNRKKLDEARKEAERLFTAEADVFSVLWMNGLLGYVEGSKQVERQVFYSEDSLDEFHLPLGKNHYVFHPIIIDAVNIAPIGSKPVVPFAI